MSRAEGEMGVRSSVNGSSLLPVTLATTSLLHLHSLINVKVYILNGTKLDYYSILLIPHRAVAEILSCEYAS
jgi:hypothetical protein